jgi:hypothetical protein
MKLCALSGNGMRRSRPDRAPCGRPPSELPSSPGRHGSICTARVAAPAASSTSALSTATRWPRSELWCWGCVAVGARLGAHAGHHRALRPATGDAEQDNLMARNPQAKRVPSGDVYWVCGASMKVAAISPSSLGISCISLQSTSPPEPVNDHLNGYASLGVWALQLATFPVDTAAGATNDPYHT